jgi:hypothetical protein
VHGRGGLDKMKDLDASLLDGFAVDFCFALVVFVHILNLKTTKGLPRLRLKCLVCSENFFARFMFSFLSSFGLCQLHCQFSHG